MLQEYLSQLGIVHRDLACRNVLVGVDKQLKVSDFGLARENECYVKTTEGKLPLRWMALESIQDRVFTTKSDVLVYTYLLHVEYIRTVYTVQWTYVFMINVLYFVSHRWAFGVTLWEIATLGTIYI